MSSGFTPVNQVRLTNVAYVRLQKNGKRFEIACYRNKVVNWRNKTETDISEVLQVETVFTNVSKGLLASSKDLVDVFGTADQLLACKEILDRGELQVSEQERAALIENLFRDVASIVVEKSMNPENSRPYTISMIQNAMRQIHFSVNTNKSAKSQALEVIRKLKAVMPIARAAMLIRIVCTATAASSISSSLHDLGINLEGNKDALTFDDAGAGGQDKDAVKSVEALIDPELYRRVEEKVVTATAGKEGDSGRVEVLQLRVPASNLVSGSVPAPAGSTKAVGASEISIPTKTADDLQSSKSKGGSKKAKKKNSKVAKWIDEGDRMDSGIRMDMLLDRTYGEGSDNDSGSDEEVYGMVKPKSGKGTKKGKKIPLFTQAMHIASERAERGDAHGRPRLHSIGEESGESDDGEEDGSDDDLNARTQGLQVSDVEPVSCAARQYLGNRGDYEDTASQADTVATTPSTVSVSSEVCGGKIKGNKKGKMAKRLEKEQRKEREQKAQKLKERLQVEEDRRARHEQETALAKASDCGVHPSGSIMNGRAGEVVEAGRPMGSIQSGPGAGTSAAAAAADGKAKSCNTCGGSFPDANAYRTHFRSEWHRHNLKRKMKNIPIIPSEEEFAQLSIDDIEI
jgi:ribosome maturation protein SDO1